MTDLRVHRPQAADGYYRFHKAKIGHRFLGFLGNFGFKTDEAVAYNHYAAYYLGGPLNPITEWQHDLDESYLERWMEKLKAGGFLRRV